jgi:hypothetical protein
MRRLSGGLAGLYTEPALALDFGTYRPRDVLTFPANKDRTWRLPTELDPVRLMHNAIRAEVTKFEALLFKLGDAKLSGWQIQCIKVRHDPTRLLIFLLEFVSILHSRVSSRERTSAPRFMKREDIAADSRAARGRRDGRLAHTRDTPNPPARPARSPRSAPRRRLSHDSRQISRRSSRQLASPIFKYFTKIPATDVPDHITPNPDHIPVHNTRAHSGLVGGPQGPRGEPPRHGGPHAAPVRPEQGTRAG